MAYFCCSGKPGRVVPHIALELAEVAEGAEGTSAVLTSGLVSESTRIDLLHKYIVLGSDHVLQSSCGLNLSSL